MPLRDPKRGILVVLRHDGPMAVEQLEERVQGATELVEEMGRAGEICRLADGRWAFAAPGPPAMIQNMPDSPLDRLKAFRDSWEEGALICEESCLTRDDLDSLIAKLEQVEDIDVLPQAG